MTRTCTFFCLSILLLSGPIVKALGQISPAQGSDAPDHMPPVSSCYSGIAQLRLVPGPNPCVQGIARTRFLTAPMDFSTDLPWDCLNEVMVSVDGCKVSLVSTVNTSSALPDFSCNWLEYQGYVQSANEARIAVWVRPVSAARWVLYNTNLTTWRARGTATLTFDDLQSAITEISRRNPNLPLSQLLSQPEIVQLKADSIRFQQQLQAESQDQQHQGQQAAGQGGPGRRHLSARMLLQQQEQQPQQQQSVSSKPPLPPGVQADIGNGLVSEPIDWQARLADLFQSTGSPLLGIPENNTIVLFNNEKCNMTYEILSGGLLGAGRINQGTVGMFSGPSVAPYQLPYRFDTDREALTAAALASEEEHAPGGGRFVSRGVTVTVIVVLSVLGAVLLGSLVYLAVRLSRAPKAAAAAATRADLELNGAGIAMSPLEHQARDLGPSGGI